MDKPFKFRYANQLAGAFTLLAVVLALAGTILAGRAKGWFEGKFEVRTTFKTAEGSFGLQEGGEVLIRNTVAGRVGKIVPNEQGQMVTRFVIGKRFRPFVTVDAYARVKKKFGVAGDAFVEIVPGTGAPMADGASIECRKDEELTDTAQKLLAEVQKTALPMMQEIQQILHNVNGLIGGLEQGQGLAGSLLKDEAFNKEIQTAITATAGLLQDTRTTVRETTRLIQGIQRHWLIRKYVKQVDEGQLDQLRAVGALTDEEAKRLGEEWEAELERARAADDRPLVAQAAACLALSGMGSAPAVETEALINEARLASRLSGKPQPLAILAEGEWARRNGQPDRAVDRVLAARPLIDKDDTATRLHAEVMLAEAQCDMGELGEAKTTLERNRRLADKSEALSLQARLHRVRARVLMGEREVPAAAAEFDKEADCWRELGAYAGMAAALESAAGACAGAGKEDAAAERYFRAGRSLLTQGRRDAAMRLLETALVLARSSGDSAMVTEIENITRPAPGAVPQAHPPADVPAVVPSAVTSPVG